jgi:8-oxo-dGTP pyrophosphatase MutT (NUDIX family)
MGISPYIAHLREKIGHEALLLPAVAVIPVDEDGRVLMVRQSDDGLWATIGGAVEPDEAPDVAAKREAQEEAGITVELVALRAVVGGPEYHIRYANGDETAYVSAVFEAVITAGSPRPDGDETTELAWFSGVELARASMNGLTRALLQDAGVASWPRVAEPSRGRAGQPGGGAP